MRRSKFPRLMAAALLATLTSGCAALPTPVDTMRPVPSPAAWAQSPSTAPLAPTALQPDLLWHVSPPGAADRLWWQGGTLVVAGLTPEPYPWEDRYLTAYDTGGALRWQRDLQPARLLDADLDQAGNAYLLVGGPEPQGSVLSLDPSGQTRWASPWTSMWPRSLHVSRDGQRTVVGFDGEGGAFDGALRVLDARGQLAYPDAARARVSGFAGWPDGSGQSILMGYEGADYGLYHNQPYRGTGVRLWDAQGNALWSIINYHRPMGLSSDGRLAVVAGVPGSDSGYVPPPQDDQPAPPFGQLLWLNRAGAIVGRYRFPFAAGIRAFQMTPDGSVSVLALLNYRFAGEARAITQQHVVWLRPDGHVVWDRSLTDDLVDLSLAADGKSLLVAQHPAQGAGDWLTLQDSSGTILWRYHHPAAIKAVALSPDGAQAAVLAENGLWFFATHVKG